MPRYLYRCEKCLREFDVFHSIMEKYQICSEVSDQDCGGSLTRIPSFSSVIKHVKKDKSDVGDTTVEFIEKAREELKVDKEKLKNREFK